MNLATAEYATLGEAEIEIGIKVLAERGSANGTLPDKTVIDRDLLREAIAAADLSGRTADEQAQVTKVMARLRAKLAEANGQVAGALQTIMAVQLPKAMPATLRWASLEIMLYELYDQGRNDDILERWQHAQDYLDRIRTKKERVAGVLLANDPMCNATPGMSFGRLVRA